MNPRLIGKWIIIAFLTLEACVATSAIAGNFVVSATTTSTNWSAANWSNYPSNFTGTACTWQTAMSNAKAGDTVYFRGGTYDVAGCYYEIAAIRPCNNGTSGSPITLVNYPGEKPVINNYLSANGQKTWTSPCGDDCRYIPGDNYQWLDAVIGAFNNSYIVIDGFKVTSAYASGQIAIYNSSNIVVRNCEIEGRARSSSDPGDWGNYEGIRIYSSSNVEVSNSLIHGMYLTNTNHGNGIKLYDSSNVKIHRCTIYDTSGGIIDKDGGNNNEFHHNFIYNLYNDTSGDAQFGITAGQMSNTPASGFKIHNNVIVTSNSDDYAIATYDGSGLGVSNVKIFNNTVYSANGKGVAVNHTTGNVSNIEHWNNLSIGVEYAYRWETDSMDLDYSNYSCFFQSDNFMTPGYKPFQGIASWKSSGALSSGGNPDLNSSNIDPAITGGSTTSPDSFKLTSSSPSTLRSGGRGGSYAFYIGAWEWPLNTNQQIGYLPKNLSLPPTTPPSESGGGTIPDEAWKTEGATNLRKNAN